MWGNKPANSQEKLDSLKELEWLRTELSKLKNNIWWFDTKEKVTQYINKQFWSLDDNFKNTWTKAVSEGNDTFELFDPKTKQSKTYYIEGPFFVTGDKNKFAERSTSTFIKKIERCHQMIDQIFESNDNTRDKITWWSSQDISNLKKYTKAIKSHFDVIKDRDIWPAKKIFENMLVKYQNITSGIDAKYKSWSQYLKETETVRDFESEQKAMWKWWEYVSEKHKDQTVK